MKDDEKNKIMEILEPIIDKCVELMDRDSEDEKSGVALRLTKEVQQNESLIAMIELNIIGLIILEKEKGR